MTQYPTNAQSVGSSGGGVSQTAKDVSQTAKDQATEVAAETRHLAASLLDTVRGEVTAQAGTQQQRIAEAIHSLSKELGSMASSSSESGPLTDLAHEASRRGGEIAHWLQNRDSADVLEAARGYARRRPVTFLALCGVAGVVAGRLTRSTVATRTSVDSPGGHHPDRTVRAYPDDPAVRDLGAAGVTQPSTAGSRAANPLDATTGGYGDPIR